MKWLDFDRLILHNGSVHTMDDAGTVAEAVAFAGGQVVSVGSHGAVRREVPDAEQRDLRGAAVYPGFVDAHHHLCFAATYANAPEVRTPPYRSVPQILATVEDWANRTPEGEWIALYGYDEARLDDHRKPTRFELDGAAPSHPVLLIHYSYHEGVLNSLGLERSGLAGLRDDPPGGTMGRTGSGEPNGVVLERCFGHAEAVVREARLGNDREGWFAAANAYQERVLSAGITHVCDAAVPPSLEELYRAWAARGELRLGVTMMPIVENMLAVPSGRLSGRTTGWSEGRLSVGSLKLFLDGGTSCALCFSLRDGILQFARMIGRMIRHRSTLPWRLAQGQPFRVDAARRVHTGLLLYDEDGIERMMRQATARGFSVGIHAAGNEAIALAITALSRHDRGSLPPRIEHFFFAEDEIVRRAAGEGIHGVVQPAALRDTGEILLQSGLPGGLRFHAYGKLLEGGVPLAGSSDAPVSTFDVIAAIESAVCRQLPSGSTLDPEQAISATDVLRMYTRGGAAVLGMEGEIGQLCRGARADAVVLSEDPAQVPPERLREVGVLSTLVGGTELRVAG